MELGEVAPTAFGTASRRFGSERAEALNSTIRRSFELRIRMNAEIRVMRGYSEQQISHVQGQPSARRFWRVSGVESSSSVRAPKPVPGYRLSFSNRQGVSGVSRYVSRPMALSSQTSSNPTKWGREYFQAYPSTDRDLGSIAMGHRALLHHSFTSSPGKEQSAIQQ